jgi:hypothetical protein
LRTGSQAPHAAPNAPQLAVVAGETQVRPLQQPLEQERKSQTQAPPEQRVPAGHGPPLAPH